MMVISVACLPLLFAGNGYMVLVGMTVDALRANLGGCAAPISAVNSSQPGVVRFAGL
jgi:hypothetical protein